VVAACTVVAAYSPIAVHAAITERICNFI